MRIEAPHLTITTIAGAPPPPPPPPGLANLSGRVSFGWWKFSIPIKGATVEITDGTLRTTETDSEGRYMFEEVELAMWHGIVRSPTWIYDDATFVFELKETMSLDVKISLSLKAKMSVAFGAVAVGVGVGYGISRR